ncbi:hypothetical protein MMC07_009635 [Pseudocyphellaria aurata]|nr:hypothetical protein [Pseudocyphellaria aurata]
MTDPSHAPIPIPERSSSKRAAEESIEILQRQSSQLEGTIRESRKKLKARCSYDAQYWFDRTSIADKLLEKNRLQKMISIQSFERSNTSSKAWHESEEAEAFADTDSALTVDKKLYAAQAKKLQFDVEPVTQGTKRLFMRWFTKSSAGLGATAGKRSTQNQTRFKANLIEASNASHPDPRVEEYWCPILGCFHGKHAMKAAHIVPYSLGQDLMTDIFGAEENEKNELFSAKNGILMHSGAEERFDKGFFVIVPSANDESVEEIKAWHESTAKSYKIRVIDRDAKPMKTFLPSPMQKKLWVDLDGQELQFLSSHRPRARYLYYHYCVTMLRLSYHKNEHEKILRDHLGKKFWGTPGPYLSKSYLLALVQEIGSEDLLDGAENPQEPVEVDFTVLAAANDAVKTSLKNRRGLSSKELEEDDCEDSDDEYFEDEYSNDE